MFGRSDKDGNCQFIFADWTLLTGQDVQNSIGRGWMESVHPSDLPFTDRFLHRARQTQMPFSLRFRVRDLTGRYVWLLAQAEPKFDTPEGTFSGFSGHLTILCSSVSDAITAYGVQTDEGRHADHLSHMADHLIRARQIAETLNDVGLAVVLEAALVAVSFRLSQHHASLDGAAKLDQSPALEASFI